MRKDEYLFVYGTLLSELNHPMHSFLVEFADFMENGVVEGTLYDVGGYPGVVLGRGKSVFGEIYRVRRSAELFEALDRYEECSHDFPAPHEYERIKTWATGESGVCYNTWIYRYAFTTHGLHEITEGDYRRYLREKNAEQPS